MEGRVLVVYYSRSGTTRAVAEALAELLGGDIEEISETKGRDGWRGYLRSLIDGMEKRPSLTARWKLDPGSYDLVVIGTPIWAWSLSAPVHAYLIAHRGKIRTGAFFCTYEATGSDSVFTQMAKYLGKSPRAVCAITSSEVASKSYGPQLEAFVADLQEGAAAAKP